MITFTVSFLLSFPIVKKKKEKKTKEKPKDKPKEKQKEKSKNNLLKNGAKKSLEPEIPNTEFNSTNILSAAHIQYELIPNRCKYDIDVVCWGPVAKIITNDGQIFLFTVINNDRIWVPIRMEHYLDKMSIKEIKKFQPKIINFNIVNNINNAPGLLKNETLFIPTSKVINEETKSFKSRSVFKLVKDDLDSESDQDKKSLEAFMKNIILSCANHPKDDTPVSWLNNVVDYSVFYEAIQNVDSGKLVVNEAIYACSKDDEEPKKANGKDSKNAKKTNNTETKNDKKVKKGKETKSKDTLTVKVPAEIFFTESYMATYRVLAKNSFANNVLVFVSAKNLLSRAQKLALNPLVVKIFKIIDLPAEKVKEHDFDSVYVRYYIPEVLQCRTVAKVIDDTVMFNEAHMHFVDNIPKIRLVQQLEISKLFVEIYGNKIIKQEEQQCSLFGTHSKDFQISKIGPIFEHIEEPETKVTSVLLAVSTFDISSLAHNVWDFREAAQCHEPYLNISRNFVYDEIRYIDIKTVNEINLKPEKRDESLSEKTLLEFGTTVCVEVYLMAPQAPALVYHHAQNTFKRIFFILNEESFAKKIYNALVTYNSAIQTANNKDILTGFLLDNGNNYFFYIEGLAIGFILSLWHMVEETCPMEGQEYGADNKPICKGKVFFNTDNAFEKRLYSHFLPVGIYIINLKFPLQDILAIPGIYCRNNIPKPCLQALIKLCSLFHARYYKEVFQQNLLPLPQELVSLNLEWGVPLRWKENVFY
ncbi:uncharacterized protein LOC114332519 [Diabrotica virgifera virgifera]|uniref:Uncharacterized protein LOC114332519 n=1 Tax=Diabrotica virgifera virgifera TaxID=50390 RepID=A0A6P7FPM7_DIAVI|nr:uncharacterized protein LOC114332519 [Diabrotica virgifera virgifera]